MLNRAQRNFREQMSTIQREERKRRKEIFYSYIEDRHITSYYEGQELQLQKRAGLWFRIIRCLLFLVLLGEVWFTVFSVLLVEDIKFEIGMLYSTGISLTLFIYGLISPRLVFMASRLLVTAIFGMLTLILFASTFLLALIYIP